MITLVYDSLTLFNHFLLSCVSQATHKKCLKFSCIFWFLVSHHHGQTKNHREGDTAMAVHTADKWLEGKTALPQIK